MKKKLSVLALATGALCIASGSAHAENRLFSLNDPMAAFLETREYAKKMGATGEFRKMEGVAYDQKNNKIYIAMSSIDKTMSDGKGDIQLPENKCGIVYEGKLDSNYNIASLKPVVVGGPYNKSIKSHVSVAADGSFTSTGEDFSQANGPRITSGFANKCDVNNIANPDGLYADRHGNLWISEDTSNHVNNMLWRWDGKKLERFATVPTGAEITGIIVTDSDDVLFNVQHPSAMSKYPYNRGTVGIVNGFKSADSFKELAVPQGDDIFDVKVAKGSYQVLARVGETIPNDIYAGRFGQVNRLDGSLIGICNHPDGNMFLPITTTGDEAYLMTNFECRPGAVGKIYMKRAGDKWQVVDGENISFASVNGTWNNCNASATPWNTGLTSEEYEPMAVAGGWQANVEHMTDYLGRQANPYDYGYPVELIPDGNGDASTTATVKHYSMGRLSYEMTRIMNDGKTGYSGDDGTGTILTKYVADTAGDLSAGTIYAAKITQNADESLGIEWIELGRSTDGEVYDAIRAIDLK